MGKIFKFGGDGGSTEKRIVKADIAEKSVEFWGGDVIESLRIIHSASNIEVLGGMGGKILGSVIWPKDGVINLIELKANSYGNYHAVSSIFMQDGDEKKSFGSKGTISWDCDTGLKVKLNEVHYGIYIDALKFEIVP